jgi:UDP-glucose 4-epimerase
MREAQRKTILVTGGLGFIGSNLVPELLRRGYFVNLLDNFSCGSVKNLGPSRDHPRLKIFRGDVREEKDVQEAIRGATTVVHLAAIVSVPFSVRDPETVNSVNVGGTIRLLLASHRQGVRKFVFSSSAAVYGSSKSLPLTEKLPFEPVSPYGASKAAAEAYCSSFRLSFGLNSVVLRLMNVYGSGVAKSRYSGVISKFAAWARSGEPLRVEGDGMQTRDFVHVKDVVGAFRSVIENPGVLSGKFNIGTGRATTVLELARLFQRLSKGGSRIVFAPPRKGDVRQSYADITEARRRLGFSPRISLARGIRMLLESLKTD